MTYTTLQQSSQLLKAGLLPETADMCYKYNELEDSWTPRILQDYIDINDELKEELFLLKQYKPCWSAEKLYNLIPKLSEKESRALYPMLIKDSLFDRGFRITSVPYDTKYHEKLIDAAVEMILYCLREGKF